MSQGTTEQASSQGQTINVNVNGGGRYTTLSSEKSRKTALILCIALGIIGGHLFYVGRIGKGILYLLTGGLFFIGAIMDAIAIASGSFKDNAGAPLREW
ncbi:TM2 domain-containing protein [Desulfovibrio caledoniensis]